MPKVGAMTGCVKTLQAQRDRALARARTIPLFLNGVSATVIAQHVRRPRAEIEAVLASVTVLDIARAVSDAAQALADRSLVVALVFADGTAELSPGSQKWRAQAIAGLQRAALACAALRSAVAATGPADEPLGPDIEPSAQLVLRSLHNALRSLDGLPDGERARSELATAVKVAAQNAGRGWQAVIASLQARPKRIPQRPLTTIPIRQKTEGSTR